MDRLYTVKETMEILKVSKANIYRLTASGKLDYVKLGGRTLFKESDLSRFIDSLTKEE